MSKSVRMIESDVPEILRAANSDTVSVHAEISPDLPLSVFRPLVEAGYRIRWDRAGIVISKGKQS